MQGFCPLASGSKGNAIFVGTQTTRILIDAGISMSTIVERLHEIGVEADTIQAVIVTHEHVDHIKGLSVFCERYGVPVLTNAETAKGIYFALSTRPRFKIFTTGEPFHVGDLEIEPFSIPHDTLDPVAFIIKMLGCKIGFCTDLGCVTSLVRKSLELCDYLYLEANHEPAMVHACNRPQVYKQRVLSRQGHLSNGDCAALLGAIWHPGLKHVHLAHLSSECNAEERALAIVREHLAASGRSVPLSIAYQDKLSWAIQLDALRYTVRG